MIALGIVQHGGGRGFFEVSNGRTQKQLVDFIRRYTGPGLTKIYTDGAKAYQGIDEILGVPHEVVIHSKGEYVRGDVYTNSLEARWSELDRRLFTTYEHVSRKHFPKYLFELERYNNTRYSKSRFEELITTMIQKMPRNRYGLWLPYRPSDSEPRRDLERMD